MYKSKRSNATDISPAVKAKVWERDNRRCVLCGSPDAAPNAHYLPRSAGGLGIEENVVTLCFECHRRVDQTIERTDMLAKLREYLEIRYPDFRDKNRIYAKE